MHRKCCISHAIVCATFSAFKVFSQKKAFIMIWKIKVSDSKIKKFLMEPSTFSAQPPKMKKNPPQENLYFRKRKPQNIFYNFSKESFSYISRNRNLGTCNLRSLKIKLLIYYILYPLLLSHSFFSYQCFNNAPHRRYWTKFWLCFTS